MTFKDSIRLCLEERFYRISGRAPRPEFWYFTLFFILAQSLVFAATRYLPVVGDLLFAVIFITLLCPLVCAGVRRLHDVSHKGAVIVMPILMTVLVVLCTDVAMRSQDEKLREACIYAAIGFLFIFLAFVFLMLKPGTIGDNAYGPDPLKGDPRIEEEGQKAEEALRRYEEVKHQIKRVNPFKFTNRKE